MSELAPAVVAEDLRNLAVYAPFDDATAGMLAEAADLVDEVDRLRVGTVRVCPACDGDVEMLPTGRVCDECQAESDAELEQLRAQRAVALDMHRIYPTAIACDPYCCTCSLDEDWPCPTARALGVTP